LLGWAWLTGLGRIGTPGLFSIFLIFPFSFSFLFETKNRLKVSKMQKFEYFQVCKLSKEIGEKR
jgi:hypothetical protein